MKNKVLWICNMILPQIAYQLNEESGVKEGWLSGILDAMITYNGFSYIELGIAFPVGKGKEISFGKIQVASNMEIEVFGFHENKQELEKYQLVLEEEFCEIIDKFKPDLIHSFGTEYPHTLAAVKSFASPTKTILGIQGLCSAYAKVYMDYLPDSIKKSQTIRDFIKKDSLQCQYSKFLKRGEFEKEGISLAEHVIGRTHWDYAQAQAIHHGIKYHKMNETLRNVFYIHQWYYEQCNPYQIFISQGNYPIKGLHYMLLALPNLVKQYPQIKVCIAGDIIIRKNTLMGELKISGYGKYIRDIIKKYNLQEYVIFLGNLKEAEMVETFLKSYLFVCPSTIENSPNSIGEAMLLGMPIVTSDVGGISSIIEKDEGIIYEGVNLEKESENQNLEGIVKNLQEAIVQAFGQPKEMMKRGKKAREHAQQTHNKEINYQRLLEIYREISKVEME